MLTPNVDLNNKTILVTGAAGFIGSNLVLELLRTVENITIVGLDNVNDYYDVSLKEYRLRHVLSIVNISHAINQILIYLWVKFSIYLIRIKGFQPQRHFHHPFCRIPLPQIQRANLHLTRLCNDAAHPQLFRQGGYWEKTFDNLKCN